MNQRRVERCEQRDGIEEGGNQRSVGGVRRSGATIFAAMYSRFHPPPVWSLRHLFSLLAISKRTDCVSTIRHDVDKRV